MSHSDSTQPPAFDRDILVVGGAFCGASAALLAKRERPDYRVTIVERSEVFDRKVGESTTEVSGCFMMRKLGIASHLVHEHLPKQGLRFWFDGDSVANFEECGEIGPQAQVRLPAFQVDRAKLDAHLLEEAARAGCEVIRPGRLVDFEPNETGVEVVLETSAGERRTWKVRWLIDASGRACVTARKLGLVRSLKKEHPTGAIWGRFRGVTDFDSAEMRRRHPRAAAACRTSRALATNHLVGHGWWCWIIPLRGGEFSIGLVYDKRLFDPATLEGETNGERLKSHVMSHPVGREWFADAEPVEGDVKAYANLAYECEKVAVPGVMMVGDAAGFMDPLYSSGLDFAAFGISHAVKLTTSHATPATAGDDLMRINTGFRHAFRQWMEAIYIGKYEYLGDADLMSTAMLLDVGAFFIGPVRILYLDTEKGFLDFPYSGPIGGAFARLMRCYNRRLSVIARKRIAAGCYGCHNTGRRELYPGFGPGGGALPLFLRGLGKWARAEWSALFLRESGKEPTSGDVRLARY